MDSSCEMPFIDYLNAVDDLLEHWTGETCDQLDMDNIAAAQEDGDSLLECAQVIALDMALRRLGVKFNH